MTLNSPMARSPGGRLLEISVTGSVDSYQPTYRLEIGTDDGVLTRRVYAPNIRGGLPARAVFENVAASSVTPRVRVIDTADDSEVVGWASGSSVSITGTAPAVHPIQRPAGLRSDLPRLMFSYRVAGLAYSTNPLSDQAAVDATIGSAGMVGGDRTYTSAEDWYAAKVDPISAAHPQLGFLAFNPLGVLGEQPAATLIAQAASIAIDLYPNGTLYTTGFGSFAGLREGTTWDGWVHGEDSLVAATRRRTSLGRSINWYMSPPSSDVGVSATSPTLTGLVYSGALGIFDTMGGNLSYEDTVVGEMHAFLQSSGMPTFGEAGGFLDANLARLPSGVGTLALLASVFNSGAVTLPIPSNAIVWFRDDGAVSEAVTEARANFAGTPAEDWADAVDALSDTGELLVIKAVDLMLETPGLVSEGTTFVVELRSYNPATDIEIRAALDSLIDRLGLPDSWLVPSAARSIPRGRRGVRSRSSVINGQEGQR